MDNVHFITELITALAAIGGVAMGIRNSGKIQEVHLSINSRMEQLLQASKEAAHAAGKAEKIFENENRDT